MEASKEEDEEGTPKQRAVQSQMENQRQRFLQSNEVLEQKILKALDSDKNKVKPRSSLSRRFGSGSNPASGLFGGVMGALPEKGSDYDLTSFKRNLSKFDAVSQTNWKSYFRCDVSCYVDAKKKVCNSPSSASKMEKKLTSINLVSQKIRNKKKLQFFGKTLFRDPVASNRSHQKVQLFQINNYSTPSTRYNAVPHTNYALYENAAKTSCLNCSTAKNSASKNTSHDFYPYNYQCQGTAFRLENHPHRDPQSSYPNRSYDFTQGKYTRNAFNLKDDKSNQCTFDAGEQDQDRYSPTGDKSDGRGCKQESKHEFQQALHRKLRAEEAFRSRNLKRSCQERTHKEFIYLSSIISRQNQCKFQL